MCSILPIVKNLTMLCGVTVYYTEKRQKHGHFKVNLYLIRQKNNRIQHNNNYPVLFSDGNCITVLIH